MEPENKTEKNPQAGHGSDIRTSENRRKLIRGGLVAAPVLLALKSTPVLAVNCKLPSGFSTSGNLSRNGGAACLDPAHDPAYWLSHITGNNFTGTGVSKNTGFNTVFTPSTNANKFVDVLGSGINFSSLVVAAYLDISASAFVPGVSLANILQMLSGTYTPPGSATAWSANESENYLRYTMGLALLP